MDADRPGVGAQHAGEDLDERRLAGTVGAEQGVHLRGDREVDGAQGDDRAERLGDGGGLQKWNGHGVDEPSIVCVSRTTSSSG